MDLTSKSDPFLVLYERAAENQWKEVGRTEVIANNQAYSFPYAVTRSPAFVRKIPMVYRFEEVQILRCVVYDTDEERDSQLLDLSKQDLIGETEFKLPSVVHSKSASSFPITLGSKSRGKLTVKCEETAESTGDVLFQFHTTGVSSPHFLRISNILSPSSPPPSRRSRRDDGDDASVQDGSLPRPLVSLLDRPRHSLQL